MTPTPPRVTNLLVAKDRGVPAADRSGRRLALEDVADLGRYLAECSETAHDTGTEGAERVADGAHGAKTIKGRLGADADAMHPVDDDGRQADVLRRAVALNRELHWAGRRFDHRHRRRVTTLNGRPGLGFGIWIRHDGIAHRAPIDRGDHVALLQNTGGWR